jgi:hypothetical protein
MIGPRITPRIKSHVGPRVGVIRDAQPGSTTFSVTLADSADPAPAGNNFDITAVVQNIGAFSGSSLSMDITLDASLTYVSASGTGWSVSRVGQVVTVTRATLASGATAPTVTVTVTAGNANTTATTQASVTASNAAAPATDSESTTVAKLATAITVTDSVDPVISGGDAFSYAVVATNSNGSATLNNASVAVTLDASLTYVSASGTGWACSQSGGVVTCTRATMAPGAAPTITINVTTGTTGVTASTSGAFTSDNGTTSNGSASTTVDLVTKDATSGVYTPSSATEWTKFIARKGLSIATPDYLHLCQEASGNLADSIGSLTLTANASPAYQQTVTGWTRKGVKGDGSTSQQRFMNASGPNPSTTSVAHFALVQHNGADGTVRGIMGSATPPGNPGVSQYLSSGKVRLRVQNGATLVDTAAGNDYATGGTHPVLMLLDVTNSRFRLYTDLEKLSPAYGAGTNQTNWFIGASGTGTFANVTIAYECGWSGANAETCTDANTKALYQALGYSIPWS